MKITTEKTGRQSRKYCNHNNNKSEKKIWIHCGSFGCSLFLYNSQLENTNQSLHQTVNINMSHAILDFGLETKFLTNKHPQFCCHDQQENGVQKLLLGHQSYYGYGELYNMQVRHYPRSDRSLQVPYFSSSKERQAFERTPSILSGY